MQAGRRRAVETSVRELLERAARVLQGDSARLDAELLLACVLECTRAWLYAHAEALVDQPARAAFERLLARRVEGEPMAYIRGRQEFWSLELEVSRATLIPRPDTELLVELALQTATASSIDVLDLGTGSGAIALALARERPSWRVLGIDIDPQALEIANANAQRLGLANVTFARGNWFDAATPRRVALIVSNPPYVCDNDPCLHALRYEPRTALVAGNEGLDALRTVISDAPRHLQEGGWLLCEHGAEQGGAVRQLFTRAGFATIETCCDLAGRERVTRGRGHHASGGGEYG